MAEWPTILLPEVTNFQEGPGILAKDFVDSGVPLVRLSGLGGYEVSLDGCNFVSEKLAASKWAHFRLSPGDILISTSASFGRPAVVGELAQGAIFYTGIIRFRSKSDRLDDGYLKLFLGSKPFGDQAHAMATGSVIKHYGPSHLKRMSIDLPPVDVQRQIALVIGLLDDKIELNRRMNATLEAIAQAIFRDWFVDFGPVRRKLAGATDPAAILGNLISNPTRAAEIVALFPDALEQDGLPEGWRSEPLDQIAEFLNGLALQKFPARAGEPDLPVIKIAELRNGVSAKSNRASRDLPAKYVIDNGDYIFSWSGSLLAKVWSEGKGALNQHLFKVSSRQFPQWFYAGWVQHHLPEFQMIAASKATTMGHIQRGHLSAAMTVRPDEPCLTAMDQIMAPIWQLMLHNDLESRTLAETRDYLLPRLMSGQVRVAQAKGEAN